MQQVREAIDVIRVRVLGASEISIGHRRIGMNTEILFALALHLTTRAGEQLVREELLERFWTRGTSDQRRHALRQLLYRLRQKGLTLDEDGERILLEPARVDSDLRNALVDRWVEDASVAAIDAAADLTPRFSRRMPVAFHEWLDRVRNRLESQHRKASLIQIVLARREGRWADLERWAHAVLSGDPLNEEATLARAESAAMAGSKTIALEILDNYLQEVGEISPELGRPAAQLRRRIAERRPDWVLRGPKEVALIGRTELMTRLTGLVEAAWSGEGSAVVLTGAPGIGKTRLAMEARAYADLKGMKTVVVRADAANAERPLAVVQELIESLLDLPGAVGCDPESLRLVRKVVERKRAASHRDTAAFMVSLRDSLLDAVRDLLEAVMHEGRILVVTDDFHHVDGGSRAILRNLMLATARTRMTWISCARSGPQSDELRKGIDGAIPLVRVDGLTELDARNLALATSTAHSFALSEAVLTSVAVASAGNPLFVRELSVARGRRPDLTSLPGTLSHLIAERLARLPGSHLRALRVIALLGSDATPTRLHAIMGGKRSGLTDVIEALESDDIVHATSAMSVALHECWQQAILDSLKGATRCSLSHECALALAAETGMITSPHTLWRAAELFCGAGERGRAVPLFEIAAEHLFASGLPHEAASVLQRTTTLVTSGPDKIRLLSRLATVCMAAGDPNRVLATSSELLGMRGLQGDSSGDDIATCLCARADALMRLGQDVVSELSELEALASDEALPAAVRQQICLTGIRVAVSHGRAAQTQHFYQISRTVGSERGVSTMSGLTALVYHTEMGSLADLVEADSALSRLEPDEPSLYRRCLAHRFRCYSLRVRGQVNAAIAEGERAFALARSQSLFHDAHLACEVLAFLHLDQNDTERAALWIGRLKDVSTRTPYPELTVALNHAADRFQMQSGKYSEVAARLAERIHTIRAQGRPETRSAELATLAFCLARSGQSDEAVQVLSEAQQAVAPIRSRFAADYSVELFVRTLRLLGADAEADTVADKHIVELSIKFDRPLPPFYVELRAATASLAAFPDRVLSGPPHN